MPACNDQACDNDDAGWHEQHGLMQVLPEENDSAMKWA